jgi:UDP-N-acetylglucosamine 4,6-dehydratase/5-epimerase
MNGKTILITGGTGSFGKRFVERLLDNYDCEKIIIYSRDELKQFEMREELASHKKFKCLRFFIGDIRDKSRLMTALNNVDYVIHSAALKQIDTAEINPHECIKTNIVGTQNLIEACIEKNVKRVVALSTDKAVDPINLYGATKLAADKLMISANLISVHKDTIFSVVRYGNVINSRGSVIPFFKKLINQKAQHIPLTDKRMTRFFITLDESVEFVIKSFERMQGGEIFIPKLPSIKIIDIIKALDKNYKIKITGIRPGEKIHEVLCPVSTAHLTLDFKDHLILLPTVDLNKNYLVNKKKEKGKLVKESFIYSSDKNQKFLNIKEIKEIINRNDPL